MNNKLQYIDNLLGDWDKPTYKGLRKAAINKYQLTTEFWLTKNLVKY